MPTEVCERKKKHLKITVREVLNFISDFGKGYNTQLITKLYLVKNTSTIANFQSQR